MMKNFHEDVTEFNDNVAEIERWPLWWRCKEPQPSSDLVDVLLAAPPPWLTPHTLCSD
jgi:hypothetical protein